MQQYALLQTKLHVPRVRPELVSRPRLIGRLNTGLDRKLVLISAPAGFGKTTLLSEWVQAMGGATPPIAIAWLSLDEGDNDPSRFLAYLVAALQTIDKSVGQGAMAVLQSPGMVNVEAVLTSLLNRITEFPEQVVLVLDDYHVIESQPVDKAITFLLEHLPSQMHLVIASRSDPSLNLSRLRARGQMTEIRVDNLRFSHDEAVAYLNQVLGFELSDQDVVALGERTEGWIAGLQLAALSMQGLKRSSEVAGFVHRFTGSDRYIQDYLTDEVLQQRPKGTRDFLLQTSILNRLSGSLCDAVSKQKNSQAILEALEAANLFIVPLDNERRWYRYHQLFADLLRSRLRRLNPDRVVVLHQRASKWLEEEGMVAEAVKHAFSAGDFDRAAALIESAARGTMLHGGLTTLHRWLDALPEGLLDSRPRLRLYQAWALGLQGEPKAAARLLQETNSTLDRLPSSAENRALRGELASMLAAIIIHRNDPPRIVRAAKEALACLPEESRISRARAYLALGAGYYYGDAMQQGVEALQEARDLALRAKHPFLAAAAVEQMAHVLIFHQGLLRDAAAHLARILELGRMEDSSHQAFTGMAHVLLAEIDLERNNLEAAAQYLERGEALLQRGGIGYMSAHTNCARARLRMALGETEDAIEALRAAERATEASPLMHYLIHNLARQVELLLVHGDIEMARQWALGRKCQLPEALPTWASEIQQLSLARVYLAQGDSQEAMAMLDRILPQAESAGRSAHAIDIYLLKALILQEQGKSDAAIECLKSSLSLAAPEGYIRTFLDHGEPMARLLREGAARGILPDYADRLLAVLGSWEKGEGTAPPQPLIEPLSPRELEVLRLLAQGLSNREIGERLFVALDTVKGHNYRIYGKLQVQRRTEAVARARELGLL